MLKTNENGYIYLSDDFKVSGDAFFTDADGVPTLPIGTLLIQETRAPRGYLINEEVFLRQITDDGGSAEHVDTYNYPTVAETPETSSIEIVKTSETGTVSGWKFKVTGPGCPSGTTATTNASGEIELPDL